MIRATRRYAHAFQHNSSPLGFKTHGRNTASQLFGAQNYPTTQIRKFSFRLCAKTPRGAEIYKGWNDRRDGEDNNEYILRSMEEYLRLHQEASTAGKSALFLGLERAVAEEREIGHGKKENHLEPGHVFVYLTNDAGDIVPKTTISLRNGEARNEYALYFMVPPKGEKEGMQPVYKTKFYIDDAEIKKFFGKKGSNEYNSAILFLIKVPMLQFKNRTGHAKKNEGTFIDDFIKHAARIQEDMGKKEYTLCQGQIKWKDGSVKEESRNPVNCVTAAMGVLNIAADELYKKEHNPSPQMFVRAFIKLVLDENESATIIGNSGYKAKIMEKPPQLADFAGIDAIWVKSSNTLYIVDTDDIIAIDRDTNTESLYTDLENMNNEKALNKVLDQHQETLLKKNVKSKNSIHYNTDTRKRDITLTLGPGY